MALVRMLRQEFPDGSFRLIDISTGEVLTNEDPGLSDSHNRTKISQVPAKIEIYSGGSLISAKIKSGRAYPIQPKKRQKINGFSKPSRRRLLKTMAKIDRGFKPIFITLTYPAEWPNDPKMWKYHLKLFLKRLNYHYPKSCGVWKLEPQKRGAPHYHLLVWGLKFEQDLKFWISLNWYEVVNSKDINHLKAGTRVERITTWNGVMSYASKYLGKEVQEDALWGDVGRFWGVFMRDSIPFANLLIYEVPERVAFQMIRYFRRVSGLRNRSRQGMSLFIDDSEQWTRLMEFHT